MMTATLSAVYCLARASTSRDFVVMTATILAICCLARAGPSGNFVVMTATISVVCCLARAGASGNFVVMTARVLGDLLQVAVMMVDGVHGDLLQIAPHSWFGAQDGTTCSWKIGGIASNEALLLDALSHSHELERLSFSCNSPKRIIACSVPMPILLSRAFSSKDLLID